MDTVASQITSLTVVYSTVYSGADQRKHQSSPSLAFVWGIHRGPVNSPHKWPVTRKMFPFDDVIMSNCEYSQSMWVLLFPNTPLWKASPNCMRDHALFEHVVQSHVVMVGSLSGNVVCGGLIALWHSGLFNRIPFCGITCIQMETWSHKLNRLSIPIKFTATYDSLTVLWDILLNLYESFSR